MPRTDAKRMLRAWELGIGAGPRGRARAILRAFSPRLDAEQVLSLSLGGLGRELFRIRTRLFGQRFTACVPCSGCGERMQIEFDAERVLEHRRAELPSHVTLHLPDELVIVARPPSVGDLEVASTAADVEAAQRVILRRCIQSARRGPQPIDAGELPARTLEALGTRLENADPDAHIELEARCPGCGRVTQHAFDIVTFLWAEIEGEAVRLLHEVHRLARGYGWREADVLAMSPLRRRAYMEMMPL
jgi:hypothetical protein